LAASRCPTPCSTRSAAPRSRSRAGHDAGGKGFKSVNVQLRQELELYANLRPSRTLPGIPCRFEGVDLVVVRENTEDLYAGLEHTVVPGVVESLKIITAKASSGSSKFAFEYARKMGSKRVTAVHKANIMKLSDGLFLDCFRQIAADYPDIQADDRIVDALCMNLVIKPEQFDVLLLENLYGDIVSDLCAGSWAAWASSAGRTSARSTRSSKRCTAARPTSRDAISRTRWR
jgi:isocitrate dehydrogenase (NAD+)